MARQRREGTYPAIWTAVCRIPRGKVSSYGQIASLAGFPGQPRLAGYALHNIPPGSDIPWHRVLNAQGKSPSPEQSAKSSGSCWSGKVWSSCVTASISADTDGRGKKRGDTRELRHFPFMRITHAALRTQTYFQNGIHRRSCTGYRGFARHRARRGGAVCTGWRPGRGPLQHR